MNKVLNKTLLVLPFMVGLVLVACSSSPRPLQLELAPSKSTGFSNIAPLHASDLNINAPAILETTNKDPLVDIEEVDGFYTLTKGSKEALINKFLDTYKADVLLVPRFSVIKTGFRKYKVTLTGRPATLKQK
ncbi:hypothetical protein BKH43_05770 [Helicobacter sp. 13S00401-1]|uniref:hypothetical protein n=1 Tax=Helicobacter sp. 13S00401-1 TaxID=1905758 RepID=UPI000BA73C73|nr:hypothetical protein [Helicobacter sp. 13S00401-1]PAF50117.1 hypothetical protein BKH43_05770 [Helicobacter sp. 13S00401-1]